MRKFFLPTSSNASLCLAALFGLLLMLACPAAPAAAGSGVRIPQKEDRAAVRLAVEMLANHLAGLRPAPAALADAAAGLPRPDFSLAGFKISSVRLFSFERGGGQGAGLARGSLEMADEYGRKAAWVFKLSYRLGAKGFKITKAALVPCRFAVPKVRLGYMPYLVLPKKLPRKVKGWRGVFAAFTSPVKPKFKGPRQGLAAFFLMQPLLPGGSFQVVIIDPASLKPASRDDFRVIRGQADGWPVILVKGRLPGKPGSPLVAGLFYRPAAGPLAGRRQLIHAGELNEEPAQGKGAAYKRALAYASLGHVAQARAWLAQARGDGKNALAKLLAMDQGARAPAKGKGGRFNGHASMGLAYNDNIGQLPGSAAKPSNLKSKDDWSLNYSLGGNYLLYKGRGHSISLAGFFNGIMSYNSNDFDFVIAGLSLGWKKVLAPFQVRAVAGYMYTMQDLEGVASTFSLTPGISWQQASWTWSSLDLRLAYTDYLREDNQARKELDDAPTVSDEFSLNSMLLDASWTISQNFLWRDKLIAGEKTFLRLGGGYMNNSQSGGNSDHASYRLFVNLRQGLPRDFSAAFSFSWRRAEYDLKPHPLSSNGGTRDDDSYVAVLSLGKKLSGNLSATLSWRYIENQSSIEEFYGYQQNMVTLFFNYSF